MDIVYALLSLLLGIGYSITLVVTFAVVGVCDKGVYGDERRLLVAAFVLGLITLCVVGYHTARFLKFLASGQPIRTWRIERYQKLCRLRDEMIQDFGGNKYMSKRIANIEHQVVRALNRL